MSDLPLSRSGDYPKDDRVRIGQIELETNNATHIQQFVLSLVDDGWYTETEWHDSGVHVTVYYNDDVVMNQ